MGLLPASVTRLFESGYERAYSTASPAEYESQSNLKSQGNNGDLEQSQSQSREGAHSRVRIQDSLATLPDQNTPLLGDSHRTVEFHAYADQLPFGVPLPIV